LVLGFAVKLSLDTIVLIVPFVAFFVFSAYPFFSQIIMLEERKGIFGRNAEIRGGNYLTLLILNAVFLLVVVCNAFANVCGMGATFYYRIGNILLTTFLTQPFSLVIMTIVYQQLTGKDRKD